MVVLLSPCGGRTDELVWGTVPKNDIINVDVPNALSSAYSSEEATSSSDTKMLSVLLTAFSDGNWLHTKTNTRWS